MYGCNAYVTVLLMLFTSSYMTSAHYILDDSKCRNSKLPVLRNTLKYDFLVDEKTDTDPSSGEAHEQIQCRYATRKQQQGSDSTYQLQSTACDFKFLWPQKITCEADYVLDYFATQDEADDDFQTFALVFSHWNCYSHDNPMTSGIQMICPFRVNNTLCDVHMSQCFVRFSGQESMRSFIVILLVATVFGCLSIGMILLIWYLSPKEDASDIKLKLF